MGQDQSQNPTSEEQEELSMVGATPQQIKAIRNEAQTSKQPIAGVPNEEELARTQAEEKNLPYVNLVDFKIDKKLLNFIPQNIAQELRTIPYLKIGNQIRCAIDQLVMLEDSKQKIGQILAEQGLKPLMVLCSKASLEQALSQYQETFETSAKPVLEKPEPQPRERSQKKVQVKPEIEETSDLKTLEARIKQVPTTELLQTLLAGAAINRASDIHIVPQEAFARIRFRIDGVLQDVAQIMLHDYKKLLSRIKYHSKIRLNVSIKPQDGRFELEVAKKRIDIRVSTFPSINGETVVLRLLEEEKEFYQLEELGFNDEVLKKIRKAMARPNGMIMNTGPTGSGKTTTLYAILDKLNKPEIKIITLEDPIEYHLQGITQTQIDPEHDFPFSIGLKHALRQDPDIIMVGEIRDKITAATALHASLTGHLMLTTFHTNSASATFIRLMDMGIRPFLLVGSINLTMAQRLVRKLCNNCKQEYTPTKEEIATLKNMSKNDKLEVPKLYKKVGCAKCNQTGYKGRVAIAEAIIPDKKLERILLAKPTQSQIEELAVEQGMTTMAQDGVKRAIEGTTSIEELLRVVAE